MLGLACVLALAGVASAQLLMDGIRCGQLTCQPDQYCSPETNRCAPCTVVCNKTHHNFDSGLCIKECQGYLLDLRYQRRGEGGDPTDYSSVQRQAQTALILSGVAIAVLLLVIIIMCRGRLSWRYIKQKLQPPKNRVKTYPGDNTHHNPHAEMPKPKPDLKLDIRNPEPKRTQPLNPRDLESRNSQADKSQGVTTPKTMSTGLTRYPAEDATLDYSYDNMAMNETPPEQIGLPMNHRF